MNTADQQRIEEGLGRLREDADPDPQDVRRAAVAILLRGASLAEADVLLMRRAEREGDRWSGQIGLPGGHEEDFDADLIATARRESVEEVGIDPGTPDGRLLGTMPATQARARGARLALYITPVVFQRVEVEAPTLGPEADEAFWMPLSLAHSGELDEELPYEHEGLVHRLPSWKFEGHTIWGMTHGILSRFLKAVH